MAKTEEMKFHVKAIVLKEREKVLFAEVDNKLVDVLLSFLTLPLGTIVRLLVKYHEAREAPIIGSLNSLYRSLETMDSSFFRAEEAKMMLLQPRSPFGLECAKLKINIDDTPPIQFYACEKGKCISMYFDTKTCHCGLLVNKQVPMEDLYKRSELYCQAFSKDDGVFTRSLSSFILGDYLQILPNNAESRSQILRQYHVEGKDMFEEMSFSWGFQQIMALLEGSLLSKTPLSNIIFRTPWEMRKDVSPAVKSKQNSLMGKARLRVTVKVFVQRSTKRVLFIGSEADFIEILFGFLALPLGTAHRLCDGDCGLGSIGNLYDSTFRMDMKTHVKEAPIHRFISNSKLPYSYKSAALQNFQVKEDDPPNKLAYRCWYPCLPSRCHMNFIDPKGGKIFLKSPYSLTVMEDLEVSGGPAGLIISTLQRLDICLSEIQEQDLEFGVIAFKFFCSGLLNLIGIYFVAAVIMLTKGNSSLKMCFNRWIETILEVIADGMKFF